MYLIRHIRKHVSFCGKEFTTHNSQQLYCNGPHIAICEMCGKEFEISLEQIHRKTTVCSEECRVEKIFEKSVRRICISKLENISK